MITWIPSKLRWETDKGVLGEILLSFKNKRRVYPNDRIIYISLKDSHYILLHLRASSFIFSSITGSFSSMFMPMSLAMSIFAASSLPLIVVI